jgi:hypothetical protein
VEDSESPPFFWAEAPCGAEGVAVVTVELAPSSFELSSVDPEFEATFRVELGDPSSADPFATAANALFTAWVDCSEPDSDSDEAESPALDEVDRELDDGIDWLEEASANRAST